MNATHELEPFSVSLKSDAPGIYAMAVFVEYVIGAQKKSVKVGDVPKLVGFYVERTKCI
jgi:hypothetical protein